MIFLLWGCDVDSTGLGRVDGDALQLSRVAITDTESLDRPIVGNERVYTPSRHVFPTGLQEGQEIAIAHMTITTSDPEGLKLRLVNLQTGDAITLARVSAMAGDSIGDGTQPVATVVDILRAGGGVYWMTDPDSDRDDLRQRVGFAVPEASLKPAAILHAYVSETSGGAPLGGDRIELAHTFFYLAALGDSAMWGNGLREKDKFTSLVAKTIEEETGRRVIRSVYALSGAAIVPAEDDRLCTVNCNGEAPTALTSITLQARSMPQPESMDLILLDGCGNDIGLDEILSSDDMTAEIEDDAQRYCLAEMANLLLRVRALAPDTPIVVTGYFPFVSMDSDVSNLGDWTQSQGIDLGSADDYAEPALAMVANSATFHAASTAALAEAVAMVSVMEDDDPPIAFADAGFKPENAAFASQAWLWGLTDEAGIAATLDIGLKFVPEDPLLDERLAACLDPDVVHDFLNCVYASAGHPNPDGAKAFAQAITQTLREIGVLPTNPQ